MYNGSYWEQCVPTSNSHWSLRFNAFHIKNQIVQLDTIELQMILVNWNRKESFGCAFFLHIHGCGAKPGKAYGSGFCQFPGCFLRCSAYTDWFESKLGSENGHQRSVDGKKQIWEHPFGILTASKSSDITKFHTILQDISLSQTFTRLQVFLGVFQFIWDFSIRSIQYVNIPRCTGSWFERCWCVRAIPELIGGNMNI